MFSLEESAGMRALMWVFQLYLLFYFCPRTLIDVVLFIMVLLQMIVQLQLCFLEMCRCWHFVGERETPLRHNYSVAPIFDVEKEWVSVVNYVFVFF